MPNANVNASANGHAIHPAAVNVTGPVTIDGPAGVGKSTAAKLFARRLGLMYLDTGATYRALAYAANAKGVDLADVRGLVRLARSMRLSLRRKADGRIHVILNRQDVTNRIRTERITAAAAVIAQHTAVRQVLVRLQRALAGTEPCVAEGRDTGTVVFPDACYKFFLTANARIRAKRRQQELRTLHLTAPSLGTLARQLVSRDRLDRTRKVGPLVRPRGAIVIDTSAMEAGEVVDRMVEHVRERAAG
jgi:cytidylate kinase